MKRKLIVFLMIWVLFILQSTIFQFLEIASTTPNLLLILTVSLGFMRGKREGLFTGFVKPRSADHHPFAMLATKSEMVQRTFRTGKIDKHIKIIFYRIEAALHGNACFPCTSQLTGVAAQ